VSDSMSASSGIYKNGKYQDEYQDGKQDEKQDEKLNYYSSDFDIHKNDSDDFEVVHAKQWIEEKVAASRKGNTAVNPHHYKCHLPPSEVPYQWMQTQWFESEKEARSLAKALCGEMQAYDEESIRTMQLHIYIAKVRMNANKYYSRYGRKDENVQELQKEQWYLKAAELALTGPFHGNGMPYLPDEC